ncbi:LuxR C-terminal-related transcriptional regulator [Ferrovum sp. PN-J185]|uniref:response regulator transcription factor n=1 Tax=Ferrovum sp. PN-J185 TaxID=1356306 RepID=UPI0007955424|nr:LuxR C-terminal-related transcriptional regulator [Ferrovum sp. PN-J185]KXW55221.1 response regulator [Ferrovum sp. PN-J185]MCC6068036.1 LuxR C-terminal-related transcriptional regulator [Ferrovum sp. PN-J185]
MSESSAVRVFASSQHHIAILGVRSLIESTQRPLYWMGNEPPSHTILTTLERKKPHVIVADPSILQFNFDLPNQLHNKNIGLLIMVPDRNLVQQETLIKAGAKAVVSWNETPGTFISAIEQVAQLKPWFSPELGLRLMERAISGYIDENISHEEVLIRKLSNREKQIIAYVVRYPDATIRELSQLIHLSPSTIRNYLSEIYKKLELKGKAALIAFSLERQIILPIPN